jgi:ribonuclease P protein component
MDAPKLTLPKTERLSSKISIDRLFARGQSFVVFPYRVVYTLMPAEGRFAEPGAAMLVSVPKKRFKRAVKRNLLRRRSKEAYRLNKLELTELLKSAGLHADIAFLYLDKEVRDYDKMEPKMREALQTLARRVGEHCPTQPSQPC